MKVLYLDESGDHNLVKIHPDYPVIVLGGVIVDRAYARTVIAPRLRQLKLDFFDDEEVILHTTEIIRTRNQFEVLKNTELRNRFYAELNAMMSELEYTVVACAIRKPEHLAKYGDNAVDPYMYSLEVLVERFCHEIGNVKDGGIIYAEKRGPDLDGQLERAWLKLQTRGSTYTPGNRLNDRIIDLIVRDKSLNIAGMQLADLVVSPIGRHVMGKPPQADWKIVESKFRRLGPNRNYRGTGLVILPN
jgi:hypothetical protein